VDGSCEALIVAADRYDDAELQRLRLPAQDIGRLAEVLADPGIGGFAVRSVIDQPTHIVTRAIQRFLTNRQPSDHLLLYVSCHAITSSEGRTYFAASNTHRRRLEPTAISATLLNDLIDQSQSRDIILVLDCCHSRVSIPGSNPPQSSVMPDLAHSGHTLLTASTANEYTWAGDQLSGEAKPSRFTGALVDGLRNREADADGDGVVSVRDLHQYLSQRGENAEYHPAALVSTTGVDTVFVCQARRGALFTDLPLKDRLLRAKVRGLRQQPDQPEQCCPRYRSGHDNLAVMLDCDALGPVGVTEEVHREFATGAEVRVGLAVDRIT
jgi:hypothetical protein